MWYSHEFIRRLLRGGLQYSEARLVMQRNDNTAHRVGVAGRPQGAPDLCPLYNLLLFLNL